jgi:hypothetical protein
MRRRSPTCAHSCLRVVLCLCSSRFARRAGNGSGYAERGLAISEQHGFRQWLGLCRPIRGICTAALDESAGRLDEVKAALSEYQRAGYQLGITAQFALLCPVLLLRNEPEAALEVIDHGLSIVSHNSERFLEAELYRLKAWALLMRPGRRGGILDQGLQTARSQHARALELRAATDLAKLWMNQGKRAEAFDILGSIYGRFTEGFDTRDLKDAKAVLAALVIFSAAAGLQRPATQCP